MNREAAEKKILLQTKKIISLILTTEQKTFIQSDTVKRQRRSKKITLPTEGHIHRTSLVLNKT